LLGNILALLIFQVKLSGLKVDHFHRGNFLASHFENAFILFGEAK